MAALETTSLTDEYLSIIDDINASLKLMAKSLTNLEKLRETAIQEEKLEDQLTKDIMHFLELEEYKPGNYQKLGKTLKESRLNRRDAKDVRLTIHDLKLCMNWDEIYELKNQFQNTLIKLNKFEPIWEVDRKYKYKYLDINLNKKKEEDDRIHEFSNK